MSKVKSRKRTGNTKPKTQLYANLANHGIARVVIEYDGSCDSGCIGEIELFGIDDKAMPMPEGRVKYTSKVREYNEQTKQYESRRKSCAGPLLEAIETWCYDLLELHFPGWEIDDGSDGTIELNVLMKTGTWEHNARFTDVSTETLEV